IRRPRNAFICFRSAYVKAEKSESARPETINQTAMSCSAGAVWRGLSAEERRPYIVMAQEEKLEHALKYPDYRYTP
ncbi:high mobility group box domain-containing protein, partial [Mycena galopus ATCC 62051]